MRRPSAAPAIVRGSDVPLDRLPRSSRHLPDLDSFRPPDQLVAAAKISWSEIDSLRWAFNDDKLGRRDVMAARALGERLPTWRRYFDAVCKLRRARGIAIGYQEPTGPFHGSVFGQVARFLQRQESFDASIVAQLELFDTDEDARRRHFAPAATGGAVEMPRREARGR